MISKKLDFSNRVQIIDKNNKKVTLPSEALPKARLLKKTFEFYGIKLIDAKFNHQALSLVAKLTLLKLLTNLATSLVSNKNEKLNA